MTDHWLASTARHRFTDLVDAAVDGRPQFIHRRDGREVVVVSREYFEQIKPTLKSVLLQDGFAEDDDEFDHFIQEARAIFGQSLGPRESQMETLNETRSRHRRRKSSTEEKP